MPGANRRIEDLEAFFRAHQAHRAVDVVADRVRGSGNGRLRGEIGEDLLRRQPPLRRPAATWLRGRRWRLGLGPGRCAVLSEVRRRLSRTGGGWGWGGRLV